MQTLTYKELLQKFITHCINNKLPLVLGIKKPNSPNLEYIINPVGNLSEKLHYITKAYDAHLCLKSCNEVEIVDWGNNLVAHDSGFLVTVTDSNMGSTKPESNHGVGYDTDGEMMQMHDPNC